MSKKTFNKSTGYTRTYSPSSSSSSSSSYTPGQKGQYKEDRFNYAQREKDNKSSSNGIQSFLNKGKAENVIKGNNFASDLQKSSQYLYSQHPYAQALKEKYNLDDQDIINLRLGVSERGMQNKISDVYNEKVRPGVLARMGNSSFGPEYAMQFFEKGMKPSDTYNPFEKGTFSSGMYNNVMNMPFMAGVNALFGSDRGQAGMKYGSEVFGFEGEKLKNFAGAVANNPNLYDQMMNTPTMSDYKFDQYVYNVGRDVNRETNNNSGGIMPIVEPAPYDFVRDNPFFNWCLLYW